jgi:hypothetical protein
MTIILKMKDGDQHRLASISGGAEEITKKVVEARRHPESMLGFELDTVPAGQMVYVDPADVSTVRNDRW